MSRPRPRRDMSRAEMISAFSIAIRSRSMESLSDLTTRFRIRGSTYAEMKQIACDYGGVDAAEWDGLLEDVEEWEGAQ